MHGPDIQWYVVLSALLFTTGALGVMLRRNPLIILLSAFTGAVVGIALIVARGRDRNIPIPFGPYLAAAGWIALMWGDQLVGAYLRMSGIG